LEAGVAGAERSIEQTSAAVREFNRFYTNVIGLLHAGYLHTPYTLTEARVIFELAHQDAKDSAELRRALDLDAGYLSRILARFESDGLITRARSRADGRRHLISLTAAGKTAFKVLDERANAQVRELLAGFTEDDTRRLTTAMRAIRQVIDGALPPASTAALRPPLPGELGWVVQRNGAIYAQEYGWDETYEALVARIVADYASGHDPRTESAWIAELDGEPVGCVFCMRKSESVAQLRLLLVEPHARGMGLGDRLVAECLRFAKRAGYAEMMLWTNDVLVHARRIYENAGFELAESERHHSFGHDLVGQIWKLPLT
jgi:DNA-binding MarR family transcriptional regulator/GNAT superfamily N-acetyltransferase